MPKYRKFYVKATESWDINDMPDDFTRLLWVMLPLGLCRKGRGVDNPAWIKSKIFPLRLDVTAKMILDAMAWYVGRGMVERYTVNGRAFFHIPTWHDYQGNTIKEANSIYPPPPQEQQVDNSVPTPELVQSESSTDSVFSIQYSDAHVDSQPPSSGEKTPQQEIDDFHGTSTPPQVQPEQKPTKEERKKALQAVAGVDVLDGAMLALENAQEKPWTVPAQAGGADPWIPVMAAFCAMHGLSPRHIKESKRDPWARKLESIANSARASPTQMVVAITAIPDSDYAFKVRGAYSTPYKRAFEDDVCMIVAQIAAGQDIRTKGKGNNGRHPTATGQPAEVPQLATGFRDFPDD